MRDEEDEDDDDDDEDEMMITQLPAPGFEPLRQPQKKRLILSHNTPPFYDTIN